MQTHILKCWPPYFEAVRKGEKTFEIRVNDRDYRSGDKLFLKEFKPCPKCKGKGWHMVPGLDKACCEEPHGIFTGRSVRAAITYTVGDEFPLLRTGTIVFGIKLLS